MCAATTLAAQRAGCNALHDPAASLCPRVGGRGGSRDGGLGRPRGAGRLPRHQEQGGQVRATGSAKHHACNVLCALLPTLPFRTDLAAAHPAPRRGLHYTLCLCIPALVTWSLRGRTLRSLARAKVHHLPDGCRGPKSRWPLADRLPLWQWLDRRADRGAAARAAAWRCAPDAPAR
eukprot:912957-Prymnesium_polylepis.3